MQVSATVYSQATKFTFDVKRVQVVDILREIEDNSEFRFFYQREQVDVEQEIDLNVEGNTVEEILTAIFKDEGISYKVLEDKLILITPDKSKLSDLYEAAQQKSITGTVTDEAGDPLPGVTVVVKGTTNGTVTSMDGNYSIFNIPEDAVLVFSFIGMRTQEITYTGKQQINVVMTESVVGLDEVIVTALGITRDKKSLGYSVGEVDGEILNATPQAGVLNSMQGKVAGVEISQTYGIKGSSVSMTIRGSSSLNSDNQPLFVVDGVPIFNAMDNQFNSVDLGNSVGDLNTDDIESISILKGPSAAALYGSRAGNGVVLITTKSGTGAQKGIGVSFNTSFIVDVPYEYIPTQNEFASGQTGAFAFAGGAYEFWGPKLDNGFIAQQKYEDSPSELISYENNKNRQEEFYETGWTQTNNLSVSGNYEKANFRVSVGNYGNKGIMPNVDLKKNNIGINGNMRLTDKLNVTVMTSLNESKSGNRPNNYDNFLTPSRAIITIGPQVDMTPYLNQETWWMDGQEGIVQRKWKDRWNNPYLLQELATTAFKRTQALTKVQLNWELFDDFSFSARYMRSSSNQNVEQKKPYNTIDAIYGYYDIESSSIREQNWEGIFSYEKIILNDFDLTANFGGNLRDNVNENIHSKTTSLVIPGFYNISNGSPGSVGYTNYYSQKKVNSLFGQVSLGYKKMVFLDLTARNDWSSTLPVENRSYFYPSASLSVLVSEMIDMPEWISLAKVRAGYAQVGNDVDPYQLQRYYGFGEDWGDTKRASVSKTAKNAQLKPEIATSKEIGADLSLFNHRISLDATYYVVENRNQVLGISTPITSGASSKLINAGLVRSNGWDVTLNTSIIRKKDLSFDVGLNYTRNRATVEELADGIEYFGFRAEQVYFYTFPGDEIGDIYHAPFVKVEDVNSEYYGQNIIYANGKPRKVSSPDEFEKIGNYNPDFIVGINPHVKYKNFSVFASFDWRSGGEFYSNTMRFFKNNGSLAGYNGGVDYDPNVDIAQQIKENPDFYINKWVGGRDSEYGGLAWPDEQTREDRSYVNASGETVYVEDASFIVGVQEDGNGGYIENYGGSGTIWLNPYSANKGVDRELGSANLYSAAYVKLRELSVTYDFPKSLVNKMKLQQLSLSLVGQNLFTWTEAGIFIDPEMAFSSRGATRYRGFEYYSVIPYTRSLGFKVNVKF
ncbi:MAG: SusC/RagA family TonB-linked outer membrane protein [Draconibacterium sp.]|nr:SusC/RagA family TonB-linked outer membrane protein [Draconibacterium sp.]